MQRTKLFTRAYWFLPDVNEYYIAVAYSLHDDLAVLTSTRIKK